MFKPQATLFPKEHLPAVISGARLAQVPLYAIIIDPIVRREMLLGLLEALITLDDLMVQTSNKHMQECIQDSCSTLVHLKADNCTSKPISDRPLVCAINSVWNILQVPDFQKEFYLILVILHVFPGVAERLAPHTPRDEYECFFPVSADCSFHDRFSTILPRPDTATIVPVNDYVDSEFAFYLAAHSYSTL